MYIAFITVGNPQRRTGGYLYHARLFEGLRAQGVQTDEIVASGAALDEQTAAAERFGVGFDLQRYHVIVIDALARGVCAKWVKQWQTIRPVVVLVHQLPSAAEADDEQIAAEQALEAPLLRADRLIAVSTHGRDMLTARGVSPDRIAVVSPGYDRLPAAGLDKVPQVAGAVQALCVAQWLPRKGITTLVEAWNRSAWPQATLELIGETDADPAYTAAVEAIIKRAPPGAVVVRGVVSDAELQQAYASADFFVLPSRFEGYGMVYAEAMAYGLPIIACDTGPVPELVGPAAGLFVPPDHVAALTAALDRLVRDAALRRQLATGARQRVAALPRWEDTVTRFWQVLIEAAQQHPAAWGDGAYPASGDCQASK